MPASQPRAVELQRQPVGGQFALFVIHPAQALDPDALALRAHGYHESLRRLSDEAGVGLTPLLEGLRFEQAAPTLAMGDGRGRAKAHCQFQFGFPGRNHSLKQHRSSRPRRMREDTG